MVPTYLSTYLCCVSVLCTPIFFSFCLETRGTGTGECILIPTYVGEIKISLQNLMTIMQESPSLSLAS